MPNINSLTKDMSRLKKKALTDLSLLLKMHADFEKDFYHLKYVSTKSLKAVKMAHNLLSSVDDLSMFEIEEEDVKTDKVKG